MQQRQTRASWAQVARIQKLSQKNLFNVLSEIWDNAIARREIKRQEMRKGGGVPCPVAEEENCGFVLEGHTLAEIHYKTFHLHMLMCPKCGKLEHSESSLRLHSQYTICNGT